ncbi:hypothetical protein MKW92_038728 [Papaver armeniacum]|nr:hypothetical protein MKW92_038728 [Papaver armeniacum]
MMCNSRLSSLHLVMDRDSSIESGVRKSKNTARKSVCRTKKPVMIDPTTPEQARVNRMKRVLKRNRALEESDLGSHSGSMDTVDHWRKFIIFANYFTITGSLSNNSQHISQVWIDSLFVLLLI